jgi:lipoate---protein ligase
VCAIELLDLLLLICTAAFLAVESMQVAALSPKLQTCSRRYLAAASGITRLTRPRVTLLASSRTYHASPPRHAEPEQEEKDGYSYTSKRLSDPFITARDHPLSLRSLHNLAPGVPHVFTSRSTSPYFNLAVEQHLLTHARSATHLLFTYANAPCVVIGRNQNPWVECDIAAIMRGTADGRDVEIVRRRSGGGAVWHDEGNLNYTVIVPGEGFERKTHVQMVVDALAWLGEKRYVFRRWKEVMATERNDIVASLQDRFRAEGADEEWFKVSGTAFKLTRGKAMHHGTLLHSSPYIDSIGSFLRSPGKDHITAKGVESVRSPVMNLWGTENAKKRRDLAWSLRKTIQQKWVEMYATTPVDEVKAVEVAAGGVEDLIPELKAGIEQLQTDFWRWEQTPGYSFDSKDVETDGKSVQLAFEVKNGLIQSVKTSTELQARFEKTLTGKKIQDISEPGEWREALMDENFSERLWRLVSLVETCFPPVKRKIRPIKTEQNPSSDIEPATQTNDPKTGTKILKRTDDEGTTELESQSNDTLLQVSAAEKPRTPPRLSEEKYWDTIHRTRRFREGDWDNAPRRFSPEKWDTLRLQHIGRLARQLRSRLAVWAGQASRLKLGTLRLRLPPTDAEARSFRHMKRSRALVFRDLRRTTVMVNVEMLRLRDRIADLRAPAQRVVLRRIFAYRDLADEVDDVARRIRGVSGELIMLLTRSLAEEKRRTAIAAASTSIRPDPLVFYEDEEEDVDVDVDPERLRHSQRILEATLQLINEEESRTRDVGDFGT